MGRKNEDEKNILPIIIDALALIGGAFGSVLFNDNIFLLIFCSVTCIVLVALLTKEFKMIGFVIGIVISCVLMFWIFPTHKKPDDEREEKVSKDVVHGTLELDVEELIMGYRDINGNSNITSKVAINEMLCDEISLNCVDYDTVISDYMIKNEKIVFENIPVGTYDILLQIDGFSKYKSDIKLKENELSDGIWKREICVQKDSEYKEFEVIISDREGDVLENYKCDLDIYGTEHQLKDMISDLDGKLPYTFKLPIDSRFELKLYYEDDETYTSEHAVDEIGNPLYVQFATPSKEKIQVTEVHKPDDVATVVSLPEWDINEDMGIDGKRYGGGIKVTISDMLISMGSNGKKDVTSRIMVPLDGNHDETIFEGVFVLDQTMYGSNSTGTISILVNNKKVFSTGKIGGKTVKAYPFKVDFGDADSLIILTKAHLSGSDFVYGFVAEK